MKQISKQKWITWAALLLALPTTYFIFINVLNEIFGINGPYDAIDPLLQKMGIRESFGWNINLLILFGPIIACVLTFFQFLKIKMDFGSEEFHFHFTVRKRWFPLLVTALSLSLLAGIFIYLFAENCNC